MPELDHEIYLLEAKWHQEPCPESELLCLPGQDRRKVEIHAKDFLFR